jgi:hypothetical protein
VAYRLAVYFLFLSIDHNDRSYHHIPYYRIPYYRIPYYHIPYYYTTILPHTQYHHAAYSGFMAGNNKTSLILLASVRNMTRRSIPNPQPAVGGKPYSKA